MKIDKNETKIVGHWILANSKMIADEGCQRIEWLKNNYLKKITTDETGWVILYQDPEDHRFWELDHEHGEMQGGGPPSLILISEFEAKEKFGL